jgi:A/G-specific adenine glycosylase
VPTSKKNPKALHAQLLLAWYKRHQRKLPWRTTLDPYKIWISEIMLQQTQVESVRPYYERFVKQFPNVKALAEAPLDTILKAWEGLGYYTRARHLHTAAQLILKTHKARIPDKKEVLLSLPGIGPYTAGAILSIAYNQDEAAVDGNLQRVLARLFNVDKDLRERETQKLLWDLARQLLPRGQAGLFNQAMMDLGATICVPQRPRCLICPLTQSCEARKVGRQNFLPVKTPKKAIPHYEIAIGLIFKRNKILIAQRPAQGLLAGLWEFPGGKKEDQETLEMCLSREIREELDISVNVENCLTTVKHAYSHFKVTIHAFRCRFIEGKPKTIGCQNWKWVTLAELSTYAFPRANHKIIRLLKTSHIKNATKPA